MKTLVIPNEFEAKEKIHTHHKMKLVSEDKKFGYLVRKKINDGISFEFQDLKKNTVAIANKKQFDFGSSI